MGNYWLDRIELDETKLRLEDFIFGALYGATFSDPTEVVTGIKHLYIEFFNENADRQHLFNSYEIKFSLRSASHNQYSLNSVTAEIIV